MERKSQDKPGGHPIQARQEVHMPYQPLTSDFEHCLGYTRPLATSNSDSKPDQPLKRATADDVCPQ